MHGETVKFTST